MRDDHFSPSTLPSRDREHLLTVRGIPQNSELRSSTYAAEIDKATAWPSR